MNKKNILTCAACKPQNPGKLGSFSEKNTVVVCRATMPQWNCSDMFTMHSTNSRIITWCIKNGDGRMEYQDPRLNGRAVIKADISSLHFSIRVELVVKKMPYERGKADWFKDAARASTSAGYPQAKDFQYLQHTFS
jgi:uncharacterized protein CbrC (UPF0167 family)